MKTVIIGLGNPILRDDSVGIKVAREINSLLATRYSLQHIDVVEVYAGGLRLMDEMAGYDRAVIIDAMVTGSAKPGSFRIFPLSSLISTKNMTCMHDSNVLTALDLGKMLGLKLPDNITVIGIEAKDVGTFGEELTEDVEKAVHIVVKKVMQEVIGERGLCSEKCLEN